MKENNLYEIVKNTILIFSERKNIFTFLVSITVFLLLFSFFYGLVQLPFPGGVIGFYRMEPPTSFEIFYMLFSAIVSALVVAITIYSVRLKIEGKTKGKSASATGLATGIFGAVCPACLGINFLAFGNVFTLQLAFLIPYIFWIQIGGIIILSLGLYLVAKSAYEKKCISCRVTPPSKKVNIDASGIAGGVNTKLISLAIIVVGLFAYQVTTILAQKTMHTSSSTGAELVTADGKKIVIEDVIQTVTPDEGFQTQVKWGDTVKKMVDAGVLDPKKLEDVLVNRYGQEMKPEWIAILNGEDAELYINNDNAVFMMYVLWTLAKHNENEILTNSPFAKYFKNYDIGVGRAGYDDTPLLALTTEQQSLTRKVTENAYRPCCNNSTAAPDCSHGYSALGLMQLMSAQGFSEKEMYETFVQFNSFWFPETYIKNALYFQITEGLEWKDVSKELIAGKEYSTLQGSYKAKNFLKKNFGI